MSNLKPVTNLSTLTKLMESLALRRLRPHIMSTGNFSDFQSAYRPGHSTETASVKVINDVITAACQQRVTWLLSLDISAAFDTIDLSILLGRFVLDFGITGRALNWLRSFATYVGVGTARSTTVNCTSGVSQGSVLALYLSLIHISEPTRPY